MKGSMRTAPRLPQLEGASRPTRRSSASPAPSRVWQRRLTRKVERELNKIDERLVEWMTRYQETRKEVRSRNGNGFR